MSKHVFTLPPFMGWPDVPSRHEGIAGKAKWAGRGKGTRPKRRKGRKGKRK